MKSKLELLLTIIIVALIVVFVGGTAIVMVNNNSASEQTLQNTNTFTNASEISYYKLETSRIVLSKTSDTQTVCTLVITPYLAYNKNDSVFYEEIARKQLIILDTIKSYFNQKTREQLLSMPEETINKQLLNLINDKVSLGKILEIYFTDYIFLE